MTKVMIRASLLALGVSLFACSGPSAGDDDSEPENGGSGGAGASGGTGGTTGGTGGTGGTAGDAPGGESGSGGTAATGGTGAVGGGGMAGGAGAAGAGGMSGASMAGAGGAGASGAAGAGGSGGAGDMRRFVPDVPNTYDSTVANPGLEVIAHTLRVGLLGMEWLVAIRNTGTDFLCALDIQNRFYDASNVEIASGNSTLVETPLARGSSGSGGLVSCLGPNQIGMAIDQFALNDLTDPSTIAAVKHDFGGLILEDGAVTNDIVVTGVRVTTDTLGRNTFTGQVRNDTDATVMNPSISIFAVNAVGRPLLEASDIELTTIAPGASWTFTTGGFEETVAEFVAFPHVSD